MAAGAKFMLIGEIGAGKTTLINALFGKAGEARKTQAIEYEGNGLDTPGEYFSHPRLYSALLCTAQDVATLVYVQAADRDECRLPPGFMDVYRGKDVVGVITKVDLPAARPRDAERLLREHGIAGPIFHVSPDASDALRSLRGLLLGCAGPAEESNG